MPRRQVTSFIALLRAVNVGGTGKLPMSDLKRLCEEAGFRSVRTYIASGNVVFESGQPAQRVKAALEKALQAYAGKPVAVCVRTADEIAEVLKCNPFPGAPGNRVVAMFLDEPPPADALTHVAGRKNEELRLGLREIYVRYDEGMAHSKLRIPAAAKGTGRNMNTVAKLVEMTKTA